MMEFIKRAEWIAATILLGASPTVFAQGGTVAQPITLTNPLNSNSFTQVLTNVIGFLFWDIAIPLTTIMVLVGAFQMMTAAGDPEKFSKGRKTLIYAAIGFGVAFLAGGVAKILQNILGGTGS